MVDGAVVPKIVDIISTEDGEVVEEPEEGYKKMYLIKMFMSYAGFSENNK